MKKTLIMKKIKRALMEHEGMIRISFHTKKRIEERGYYKGDIARCIINGTLSEVQYGWNHRLLKHMTKFVIEGKDLDNNPMVVVLSQEENNNYSVITIMPPHDKNRFKNCI